MYSGIPNSSTAVGGRAQSRPQAELLFESWCVRDSTLSWPQFADVSERFLYSGRELLCSLYLDMCPRDVSPVEGLHGVLALWIPAGGRRAVADAVGALATADDGELSAATLLVHFRRHGAEEPLVAGLAEVQQRLARALRGKLSPPLHAPPPPPSARSSWQLLGEQWRTSLPGCATPGMVRQRCWEWAHRVASAACVRAARGGSLREGRLALAAGAGSILAAEGLAADAASTAAAVAALVDARIGAVAAESALPTASHVAAALLQVAGDCSSGAGAASEAERVVLESMALTARCAAHAAPFPTPIPRLTHSCAPQPGAAVPGA